MLCSSTVQRIKKEGLHIPPNSINETTNSKSCHTELKNKYTEKNQLQTDNKTQFSLQQLMDTNGEWGNKTNKIITIFKKKKKKKMKMKKESCDLLKPSYLITDLSVFSCLSAWTGSSTALLVSWRVCSLTSPHGGLI